MLHPQPVELPQELPEEEEIEIGGQECVVLSQNNVDVGMKDLSQHASQDYLMEKLQNMDQNRMFSRNPYQENESVESSERFRPKEIQMPPDMESESEPEHLEIQQRPIEHHGFNIDNMMNVPQQVMQVPQVQEEVEEVYSEDSSIVEDLEIEPQQIQQQQPA
jgi:hypothetical protein